MDLRIACGSGMVSLIELVVLVVFYWFTHNQLRAAQNFIRRYLIQMFRGVIRGELRRGQWREPHSRRMREGVHNVESPDLEAVIISQQQQPPSYEASSNHHTGEPSVQVNFQ